MRATEPPSAILYLQRCHVKNGRASALAPIQPFVEGKAPRKKRWPAGVWRLDAALDLKRTLTTPRLPLQ